MQGAQNDVALRQTVRHLKETGARDQEIIETIGQMSMFAGLPAMTRAMQLGPRSWKIKRTRNERNGFCILPVCTLHDCGGTVHSHRQRAFSALVDFGVSVISGAVCSAGCGIRRHVADYRIRRRVAVLFLFVVMMLDIDFAALKAEMAQYLPLALLIGVILLMQLAMAFGAWDFAEHAQDHLGAPTPSDAHNTEALGLILYDQYFLLFQLAGLILLVAMVVRLF